MLLEKLEEAVDLSDPLGRFPGEPPVWGGRGCGAQLQQSVLCHVEVLDQLLCKCVQVQALGEKEPASLGDLGRGIVIGQFAVEVIPVYTDGGSGS